jgi:dTMP kinase
MFITFEGTEGSGKSTQIPLLAEFLRQKGYPVVTTREPGGTPIGDQIRLILADMKNSAMQPRTEILLFQASRAQHVEEFILPHLDQGHIILCDRFADSTLAYQGYGYQNDLEQIEAIIDFATGGLKPDLTVLLEIDAESGLQRRAQGGEWNRLDDFGTAFYQRVCEGYHKLIQADPGRWIAIDASQTVEQVQDELRRVVLERITRLRKSMD